MKIKPIAYVYTDFTEKFGIPRQSGLVSSLPGKIIFESEYSRTEAFHELSGFSHIWVIWQFSENVDKTEFSPTVRPPRLGGNRRVGVFASRSPFRPNNLGLSCVKLNSIEQEDGRIVLYVLGVDMLNKTPVYDIKPYIPSCDCIDNADEGYTKDTKNHSLTVNVPEKFKETFPEEKLNDLIALLSQDPRPGYEDDPDKEYGLLFAGCDVKFKVCDNILTIVI